MIPYFTEFSGNPSSVHHHGRQLRSAIEKARKTIATLVGAAPGEIFFTSGGTEADNMAIRCTVEGLGIRHIITTAIEHHAVLHSVEQMEKTGAKVTWLPVDAKGNPDQEALREALASDTRQALVCLMHANNEIGTLIDLHKYGRICEEFGAIFMSDTVQSMGNVQYNLAETPVHFVTASAHKFYGPKGIGFLYIRSGVKVPPLLQGGGQERNMRAGTENVPAIVGMAFALEKCINNLEAKRTHLLGLKKQMAEGLKASFPEIVFHGETGEDNSIPTVLNAGFPGAGTESMLLFNLDINGISASGGSACTSGSVKGSHVLEGLGVAPGLAANSIRFSFGMQNTPEEIEYALERLREMFRVKV